MWLDNTEVYTTKTLDAALYTLSEALENVTEALNVCFRRIGVHIYTTFDHPAYKETAEEKAIRENIVYERRIWRVPRYIRSKSQPTILIDQRKKYRARSTC